MTSGLQFLPLTMKADVNLSVWDYLVFVLMLILSSAIGIYYGYKGRQKSTKEYLTASGSMHWLPISVSLLASFLSAIALMGIPSEIYTYGIQYFITYLSFVVMLLLSAWIYAPIFYQTKVTSANEVRKLDINSLFPYSYLSFYSISFKSYYLHYYSHFRSFLSHCSQYIWPVHADQV